MNEFEYSFVKYITESYNDKFGTSIAFKCKNFSEIIFENKIVLYKVNSNLNNDLNMKYTIEFYINKYIEFIDKNKRFKKCIYCHKRKVNCKLSCCNKYYHKDCAVNNNYNYNCNCIEDTEKNIELKSVDESKCEHICAEENNDEDENECVVCYDKCSTKTTCNHLICRKCTNNIYKNEGIDSKCPICRSNICKEKNYYLVNKVFQENPLYFVKVIIHN